MAVPRRIRLRPLRPKEIDGSRDHEARHTLGEFACGYADYIAEWEPLIAAALEAGRIRA